MDVYSDILECTDKCGFKVQPNACLSVSSHPYSLEFLIAELHIISQVTLQTKIIVTNSLKLYKESFKRFPKFSWIFVGEKFVAERTSCMNKEDLARLDLDKYIHIFECSPEVPLPACFYDVPYKIWILSYFQCEITCATVDLLNCVTARMSFSHNIYECTLIKKIAYNGPKKYKRKFDFNIRSCRCLLDQEYIANKGLL